MTKEDIVVIIPRMRKSDGREIISSRQKPQNTRTVAGGASKLKKHKTYYTTVKR
jgi:hypothetical protein